MNNRQIDVLDMLNVFSIILQMTEANNKIDYQDYFDKIIENQKRIITLLENNQ